ncbi:MAG: hypothetical protein M3164_00665 [Actinomycetota bacterium]|nr:hypothetical protein [Actinomycetota bacterium]
MLLDEVEDPLETWQYAERYLGVGTRTYSRFAADLEISDAYHPQKGEKSFPLPTFWVTPEHGLYLRSSVESSLHEIYHDGDRFLLPVHPETVGHPGLFGRKQLLSCLKGPTVEVVPTANARTVFVERYDGHDVEPHFLKLHYPKRLSRFTRRLRRPIVTLQLWVTGELARIGAPFLPEVGAGLFTHDAKESWGFVAREVAPLRPSRIPVTVPLFSLYGSDYLSPQDPTLLEQLVVVSGECAEEYITKRIVEPMVRLWLEVVRTTGCALELHGQNALFAFSTAGAGTEIRYRDCAIYVDPLIRQHLRLGADLPPVNVISRDIPFPREQVFSLTYDSFMGHHAFEYLAKIASERLGVSHGALRHAARREFGRSGGGEDLLPKKVYYYDDALHSDGRWQLVETDAAPAWR